MTDLPWQHAFQEKPSILAKKGTVCNPGAIKGEMARVVKQHQFPNYIFMTFTKLKFKVPFQLTYGRLIIFSLVLKLY